MAYLVGQAQLQKALLKGALGTYSTLALNSRLEAMVMLPRIFSQHSSGLPESSRRPELACDQGD